MPTPLGKPSAFYPIVLIACVSCDPALVAELDLVTAGSLAGTYTGILEGVSVSSPNDLNDPDRQVIVDLDLLHQLTVRATGQLTLTMQSSVIPPLRAIVVGKGPVAINAEFVEFENLEIARDTIHFDAVKVKQIVFVQYEGEWIVVLQLVRAQVEPQLGDVYAYQYVSYPAKVAEQMSREQAIVYVNTILRLVILSEAHTRAHGEAPSHALGASEGSASALPLEMVRDFRKPAE